MAIMRKEDAPAGQAIQVGQTHTILGPEAAFEGKLTFQGAVRIDGKFTGEITTSDVLVIGEGAKVKGDLNVGSLVHNGELEGTVVAKQAVEIHSPGIMRGTLTTPTLVIDRGVVFEGTCHMENLKEQGRATKPPEASVLVDKDKK